MEEWKEERRRGDNELRISLYSYEVPEAYFKMTSTNHSTDFLS